MQVKPSKLVKGILTFVPGVAALTCRRSGGTVSARYCYAVWLRHLVSMRNSGLPTRFRAVAELGPGDSLGIGLCAMLSGADRYYAFDAKPHANVDRNQEILDVLIGLFQQRASIPGDAEFPSLSPQLKQYAFPSDILTEEILTTSLSPERLHAVRRALKEEQARNVRISYIAPWDHVSVMEPGTIDLVFSQAVMEHIDDIQTTYDALYKWLRPGGSMSHGIDYKSHFYTHNWNGHWTVSDWIWMLVRGKRPYLINRLPHSAHLRAMRQAGFDIVEELRNEDAPLARSLLASRFKGLTDEDLKTKDACIQATKRREIRPWVAMQNRQMMGKTTCDLRRRPTTS